MGRSTGGSGARALARLLAGSVLVVTASGALGACAGGGSVAAGTAQGCGSCEEETAEIRDQVGELAGIARVLEVTYSHGDHTAGPRLEVDVEVAEPPGEVVAEEIAKIGWHSDIAELESVTVARTTSDGEVLEPMFWLLAGGPEIEERTTARWGPRDG